MIVIGHIETETYTMKVYNEIKLRDYSFSRGARYFAELLTGEELDTLEEILADRYEDMGEEELDDLFEHNPEFLAELLGYEYTFTGEVVRPGDRAEEDEGYE